MTFEEFKQLRYNEPPYDLATNPLGFARSYGSDISAHLPFLEFLARKCRVIVELGTRDCYSTVAFIAGCTGRVYSYDIITTPAIQELALLDKPCEWEFRQQSSVDPATEIPVCDLLFIDTLHTYEQVKQELALHARRVKKYIVFHDTFSFPEITKAVDEFVENKCWEVIYKVNFNHGLLVLRS